MNGAVWPADGSSTTNGGLNSASTTRMEGIGVPDGGLGNRVTVTVGAAPVHRAPVAAPPLRRHAEFAKRPDRRYTPVRADRTAQVRDGAPRREPLVPLADDADAGRPGGLARVRQALPPGPGPAAAVPGAGLDHSARRAARSADHAAARLLDRRRVRAG